MPTPTTQPPSRRTPGSRGGARGNPATATSDTPSPFASFLRRQESRGAGRGASPQPPPLGARANPHNPASIPAKAGIQEHRAGQLCHSPPSISHPRSRHSCAGRNPGGRRVWQHCHSPFPTPNPPRVIPAEAGIQMGGARGNPATAHVRHPTPLRVIPAQAEPAPAKAGESTEAARAASPQPPPPAAYAHPHNPASIPADAGIQGRREGQPCHSHFRYPIPLRVIPAEAGIQRGRARGVPTTSATSCPCQPPATQPPSRRTPGSRGGARGNPATAHLRCPNSPSRHSRAGRACPREGGRILRGGGRGQRRATRTAEAQQPALTDDKGNPEEMGKPTRRPNRGGKPTAWSLPPPRDSLPRQPEASPCHPHPRHPLPPQRSRCPPSPAPA